MRCRKCGKSIQQGASLKRVNEKGVKGIWECNPVCGVPFISEEAKILHAIRGEDEEKGERGGMGDE